MARVPITPLAAAIELTSVADGHSPAGPVLHTLCRLSRDVVTAEAASVMLRENARLRFATAFPVSFCTMGRLQEELQAGPCRQSVEQHAVVRTGPDDLQRWPSMATVASAHGVSACLSVPLLARGETWGTLDLYATSPANWTNERVEAAVLLAQLAANHLAWVAKEQSASDRRTELEHRATHDVLTGLPNRALLLDRLDHALLGAARHGHSVVLLFIDLDDFKRINDTLGHAAGDRTLVEVARRLTGALRESDTLARLAGDEFVVICEDLPGSGTMIGHLEDLSRRIQAALSPPGPDAEAARASWITASIGIARARSGDSGAGAAHRLLDAADAAMYEAKRAGPGRTVIRVI